MEWPCSRDFRDICSRGLVQFGFGFLKISALGGGHDVKDWGCAESQSDGRSPWQVKA